MNASLWCAGCVAVTCPLCRCWVVQRQVAGVEGRLAVGGLVQVLGCARRCQPITAASDRNSPAVERRTNLYLGEKVIANWRRMTMMHGSRRLPVQESLAKPLIRGELPTPMQQPLVILMNKTG